MYLAEFARVESENAKFEAEEITSCGIVSVIQKIHFLFRRAIWRDRDKEKCRCSEDFRDTGNQMLEHLFKANKMLFFCFVINRMTGTITNKSL